jgi:hypothetical protein
MRCADPVGGGRGKFPISPATVTPRFLRASGVLLVVGLLAIGTRVSRAQGGFQLVSGTAFDAAVPRDFYLEGNAIPVEKRNAVVLKTPSRKHVLVALLDTSGYSSQVQQKYTGMLIAEVPLKVCEVALTAGSYGFGLNRPPRDPSGKSDLTIYDQGGRRLGACEAQEDQTLSRPVPLQVVPEAESLARIYLGRHWIPLKEARPK